MPKLHDALCASLPLKRVPTRKEIAAKMAMLEAFEQRGYDDGGFKIYDVSEPARPKLVCYHKMRRGRP
jgi:hypothetical protein